MPPLPNLGVLLSALHRRIVKRFLCLDMGAGSLGIGTHIRFQFVDGLSETLPVHELSFQFAERNTQIMRDVRRGNKIAQVFEPGRLRREIRSGRKELLELVRKLRVRSQLVCGRPRWRHGLLF